MSEYSGEIFGTGDEETRENEITADNLAFIRRFIVGYDYGVINSEGFDFDVSVGEDSAMLCVEGGIAFAYGYFGYAEAKDIVFFPPAVEQYHILYAEINRSAVPNAFTINTKNNYASPNVNKYSLRHDYLNEVKTGVCQIPLWVIMLTNKGINKTASESKRLLYDYIYQVYDSDGTTDVDSDGYAEDGVTAETAASGTSDDTVATTEFADREIYDAIYAAINE